MTTHGPNGAPPHDPDADRLGAAWNDLVTGKQPAIGDRNDELVEIVRGLHRGAPTVSPGSRFTTDLKEKIMTSTLARAHPGTLRPMPPRNLPPPTHRDPASLDLPRPLERRVPVLVSAALLLITLGTAGYATLDRDGSGGPGGPAIHAPGTPSPEADENVLLEFPLPADALPSDGFGDIGLRYFTMAPNSTASLETSPISASPGIWANYIVAGALTMTAEGEVTVIRTGGAPETVPAGTETTLAAGDSAIHDNMGSSSWTVTGTDTVEIVSLYIQDNAYIQYPNPTGWEQLRINFIYPVPIPAGDWTVRLEVMELEPDSVISAAAGGSLQSAFTAPNSDAHLARVLDSEFVLNGATTTTTAYVFTLELASEGEAMPVES